MLPPVQSITRTPSSLPENAGGAPATDQRPDEAAGDRLIRVDQGTGSAIAGRITELLLAGRGSVQNDLATIADQVGQVIGVLRAPNESDADFAGRFAAVLGRLTADQRNALQAQLAQVFQGLQLRVLLQVLNKPAGPEATLLSAYMEILRANRGDLKTQSVVQSYSQNGAGPSPAGTSPAGTSTGSASAAPPPAAPSASTNDADRTPPGSGQTSTAVGAGAGAGVGASGAVPRESGAIPADAPPFAVDGGDGPVVRPAPGAAAANGLPRAADEPMPLRLIASAVIAEALPLALAVIARLEAAGGEEALRLANPAGGSGTAPPSSGPLMSSSASAPLLSVASPLGGTGTNETNAVPDDGIAAGRMPVDVLPPEDAPGTARTVVPPSVASTPPSMAISAGSPASVAPVVAPGPAAARDAVPTGADEAGDGRNVRTQRPPGDSLSIGDGARRNDGPSREALAQGALLLRSFAESASLAPLLSPEPADGDSAALLRQMFFQTPSPEAGLIAQRAAGLAEAATRIARAVGEVPGSSVLDADGEDGEEQVRSRSQTVLSLVGAEALSPVRPNLTTPAMGVPLPVVSYLAMQDEVRADDDGLTVDAVDALGDEAPQGGGQDRREKEAEAETSAEAIDDSEGQAASPETDTSATGATGATGAAGTGGAASAARPADGPETKASSTTATAMARDPGGSDMPATPSGADASLAPPIADATTSTRGEAGQDPAGAEGEALLFLPAPASDGNSALRLDPSPGLAVPVPSAGPLAAEALYLRIADLD